VRMFVFFFAAMYIVLFGTVIYYQPTRQAVLALCFIMLAVSLTSDKNGVSRSLGENEAWSDKL
jgi:hypothetical protein